MSDSLILVIDEDPDVRDSVKALLESANFKTRTYASAIAFLADTPPDAGCMIVDMHMRKMDGLALQEEKTKRGVDFPLIIMTGHEDVRTAVRAMKAGAVDFIEKPFSDEFLLAAVQRALVIGQKSRDSVTEAKAARELLELLTPCERTVLEQLVAKCFNKVAAFELGISPRTIEIHRARIMDKMKALGFSDIVRIAIAAEYSAGNTLQQKRGYGPNLISKNAYVEYRIV